ncbi:hypothetical protein M8J76_008961 [Diaphorina citri]|nr:hypothetical protein M8J76_008961 [Diaphorina citri]
MYSGHGPSIFTCCAHCIHRDAVENRAGAFRFRSAGEGNSRGFNSSIRSVSDTREYSANFYSITPIKCEVVEEPAPPDTQPEFHDENQPQQSPSDEEDRPKNYSFGKARVSPPPFGKSRASPLSPNNPENLSLPPANFLCTPVLRFNRGRPLLPTRRRPQSASFVSPDVAYRCSSCSFGTRNKKLLNHHINQMHANPLQSEQKPFSCTYCRYRCKSPSILNVHVESVHYTDTLIDKIANK